MSNDAEKLPPAQTITEGASRWRCSTSTLRRAAGHGMLKTIYIGDKPIIPPKEVARIDEEGLPSIPTGYRRLTSGPTKLGRPPKRKPP